MPNVDRIERDSRNRSETLSNDWQALAPHVSAGIALPMVWEFTRQVLHALNKVQLSIAHAACNFERFKFEFFYIRGLA